MTNQIFIRNMNERRVLTLLRKEGIDYDLATYDDVFQGSAKFQKSLDDCSVVFASSTFLRDLSELEPILELLKRPHNKIILGGALAGALAGFGATSWVHEFPRSIDLKIPRLVPKNRVFGLAASCRTVKVLTRPVSRP